MVPDVRERRRDTADRDVAVSIQPYTDLPGSEAEWEGRDRPERKRFEKGRKATVVGTCASCCGDAVSGAVPAFIGGLDMAGAGWQGLERRFSCLGYLARPGFWIFVFLQAIFLLAQMGVLFAKHNMAITTCSKNRPRPIEESQVGRGHHEALAIAVVVRNSSLGGPEIWTRARPKEPLDRDPMYQGRWQSLGTPLDHGESPHHALGKAFKDIFVMSADQLSEVRILGLHSGDVEYAITGQHSSSKGSGVVTDRYFVLHRPLMYVQALQGTTPWTAVGMVAIVDETTEVKPAKFGFEPIPQRWWRPAELLRELDLTPEHFVGVHYPFLRTVANDLIAGRMHLAREGLARAPLVTPKYRQDGRFADVNRTW